MKRGRGLGFYLICGLLALAGGAELLILVGNFRTRQEMETLLRALRQLRVGESTLSNTQSILSHFGARKEIVSGGAVPEERYQILVSNFSKNYWGSRYPVLWRFGLRPSAFEAELGYKKDRLSLLSFQLNASGRTSSGQLEEITAKSIVSEDTRLESDSAFRIGYDVQWSRDIVGATQVRFVGLLTAKANQQEIDTSFDFDFSCVSSFRGCQAICQIIPSVWRETIRRNENGQISLPKEVLENARCFSCQN